jgi:hypothetical protein
LEGTMTNDSREQAQAVCIAVDAYIAAKETP